MGSFKFIPLLTALLIIPGYVFGLEVTSTSDTNLTPSPTPTNSTEVKSFEIKVPFQSCGGKVLEVRALGCVDGLLPCKIIPGSKGRIEVDFVPQFDARSLFADVRGRTGSELLPVYIPLTRMHKEACVGHGISCPVTKNNRLTYHYDVVVDKRLATYKTDIIWRLTDFWGFTVACFKADIFVTSV